MQLRPSNPSTSVTVTAYCRTTFESHDPETAHSRGPFWLCEKGDSAFHPLPPPRSIRRAVDCIQSRDVQYISRASDFSGRSSDAASHRCCPKIHAAPKTKPKKVPSIRIQRRGGYDDTCGTAAASRTRTVGISLAS